MKKEPTIAEISGAIVELLRTEEIATLATLDEAGSPSTSQMHMAADGFTVYMHTFSYNRKHREMQNDPRVSYAASYLPAGGFADRFQTRSIQVKGRATLVSDPEEIRLAVKKSFEQFPWLADSSMYDNIKTPDQGQQVFYRIRPTTALWSDNRIGLFYRTILTFDEEGTNVIGVRNYNEVVKRR
ncbi:pyridoxamine 5'-phosphate oxidase family protein [Rhodococcus erythropolis]|nr:pyridoxamine 5'-phosphate oxidase family protein [Rhodococcus erythropolis]